MGKGEYLMIAIPNSLPLTDPSASTYTHKILTSQLNTLAGKI